MPRHFSPNQVSRLCLTAGLCLLIGCTGKLHKKWADREVYSILGSKSSRVPNVGKGLLNIEPNPPASLNEMAKNLKTVDFLGDRADLEKDARVITLADTLKLGVNHNRSYQGAKELIYLEALELTLTRHQFTPIIGAAASGEQLNEQIEVPPSAAIGSSPKQIETGVNDFIRKTTHTSTGGVSLASLSRTSTRLAADLSTDFVQLVTGGLRGVSDSRLALTLSQSLLRGAGHSATTEILTQGERSLLYSIRNFAQYRKTFAVDLTAQYYAALQSRDTAKNAFLAYQAFKSTVKRETGMAEANKRSPSGLGQIQNAELNYHRRWLSAIRTYEQALDTLKIEIGVPVETRILLDQKELEKLEITDPPGTLDEAIAAALTTRPDLWSDRDRVEDADRHIKVAQQELLPTLDGQLAYHVKGDPGSDGLVLDGKRRNWSAGLNVDLHLDQKPVRNNLRAAQVAQQKATRTRELAEENIRSQIRADWRDLDLAKKQHQLAIDGVALSERRLKQEEAFLLEDRGTARDLIEAQQAIIESRDQLTAALINHTTARLKLWRDMGVLFIRKDGDWAEVLNNEPPRGQQ
jgi:outer membrane protein TolC